MKIGLVAVPEHPQVQRVIKEIRKRSHDIELLAPNEMLFDYHEMSFNYDLYALKVKSDSALHTIEIAEELGINTINRSEAIRKTQDKILCDVILRKNNIPIPHSYFTKGSESLHILKNRLTFPIVYKPYKGSHNDANKVKNFDELASYGSDNLLYFQEFIENDGYDWKVYVADEQVFGIKRFSPFIKSYENKGNEDREEFDVSEDLSDIILKIGELFGLDIYGVDVVFRDDQYYIIDVNDFPGFRGIKEAPNAIANSLINAAKR